MRLPILAQQLERAFGQWHITIFSSFAVTHVYHPARAVDVGDVEIGSLLQSQAAGIDGGETNFVTRQSDERQNLVISSRLRITGSFFSRGARRIPKMDQLRSRVRS